LYVFPTLKIDNFLINFTSLTAVTISKAFPFVLKVSKLQSVKYYEVCEL